MRKRIGMTVVAALLVVGSAAAADIVHDAEYYIIEAQNGEAWKVEDQDLDAKLAELREKYGTPPNIIHIMWDDTSYGDVGIPEISKIRGFTSPNIDRMADEGILFSRMYSEVGCTPSRSAVVTGRLAVRSATYDIGFPLHNEGLNGNEVTMATHLYEVHVPFGLAHFDDQVVVPFRAIGRAAIVTCLNIESLNQDIRS